MAGRVIVKRKTAKSLQIQGHSPAEIDDIHARGEGAIAKERVVFEDSALDFRVVDVGRGREASFVAELTRGPHGDLYEYVEIDYLHSPADAVPDDPETESGRSWQHAAMESFEAWDLHTGGPSVTVAICDTGLQLDHPDLGGNRVEGYNAVTMLRESEGGDVNPVNGNSHGTRCAGCAAAIGVRTMGFDDFFWSIPENVYWNGTCWNMSFVGGNGPRGLVTWTDIV